MSAVAAAPPAAAAVPPWSPRLLLLEWRRHLGLWLVLGFAVLGAIGGVPARDEGVRTWPDAHNRLVNSTLLLRGLVAGLAAAVAARPRRRGTGDLLATTARPALARELIVWAATSLCGVLALLLGSLPLLLLTARDATWGGPGPAAFAVPVLLMPVAAAFGHAASLVWPGRVAPFLVGFFLVAVTFLLAFSSPARYLAVAVTTPVREGLWYEVRPDPAPLQLAWLAALLACFLASIVALVLRTAAARRDVLAALGLAAACSALVWLLLPSWGRPPHPLDGSAFDPASPDYGSMARLRFEPACSGDPVAVCLHPAYAAALPEVAALVNRIAEPVAGLPGVPTRAEQQEFAGTLPPSPGTFRFNARDLPDNPALPGRIADGLVGSGRWAIGLWLQQRAGYPTPCNDDRPELHDYSRGDLGGSQGAECAAAARFAALAPDAQRAWLATNIAAVRDGAIRPEDVPGG